MREAALGEGRGGRWSTPIPVDLSGQLGQDSWGLGGALNSGECSRLSSPPTEPEPQRPEARCSQAFAGLTNVIAATATPARPCFSHAVSQAEHILLHLWALAHTVFSAWNVLWLPVPGSSNQELGELSSNPAHFTSEPPVHPPCSSSLATGLVWTLGASAVLSSWGSLDLQTLFHWSISTKSVLCCFLFVCFFVLIIFSFFFFYLCIYLESGLC